MKVSSIPTSGISQSYAGPRVNLLCPACVDVWRPETYSLAAWSAGRGQQRMDMSVVREWVAHLAPSKGEEVVRANAIAMAIVVCVSRPFLRRAEGEE